MTATSKKCFDLPAKTTSEKSRGARIYAAMEARHPDATSALTWETPLQLLCATILSAQATDVGVNKATPRLFADLGTPEAMAAVTPEIIEGYINSIGLFRNKAKALHATANRLVEVYGGDVPATMEDLLTLRGVARKTANVVLGNAFGFNEGVVVDTHVSRLSQRLGLTDQTTPEKIERDLMALFPRKKWTQLSHLMVYHGRRVCRARGALCHEDAVCKGYCSNARG